MFTFIISNKKACNQVCSGRNKKGRKLTRKTSKLCDPLGLAIVGRHRVRITRKALPLLVRLQSELMLSCKEND